MKPGYGPATFNKHWLFSFSSSREVVSRVAFVLAFLAVIAMGTICFYNAFQWVGKPFAGFLMHRRLVVSVTGLPSWSGIRAGLRPADKILQIDRNAVTSVKDLEKVVRSKKIGTPVEYTVQRGEKVFTVIAPTMDFSVSDFLLTFGSSLLMGVVFLAVGMVVFVLKPDTAVSWLFCGITLLQCVLFLCEFELASTLTPFSYVYMFCDTMQPALVLHFSALFPYRFGFVKRRPWLLKSPYVVSTLLFLFYAAIFPSSFFYKCYYLIMYPYMYLGLFAFLTALLYSYFKGESSLARQRARVIFWGALVAFPLPLLSAVFLNTGIYHGLKTFTNITSLPVFIFPVAIAYSITRHNLFDVDVYIKRAVGYALMTAIVGVSYLGLQLSLKSIIPESLLGSATDYVYPVIFAFLVVFFFNPLNHRVQNIVDRVFFRKKLDYKEAVLSISNALSAVLNLEEVVQQINHAVRSEMFIDASGVIVLDATQGMHRGYFVSENVSSGTERTAAVVPDQDPLVALVCREKKLITKYDLAEDPRYAVDREICGNRFVDLEASLAIPLLYQDRVNAIIMVGHKKSGHFFSKEDIELLVTLASHGAVSIENARMAEQMQREEIVRTNLSRYLSPQIVEGILKSDMQVNLGGDRKVVTVLFSDIRDFTRITESRPPDQLVRLLNEYFNGMAEVIFSNQGSLDKYIGDAIVAVFGSLIPLENPEECAVNAAIGMMRRLEELNHYWEQRGDFPMQMGIGINTGEVFLGNIGSTERMEFTVIGDTVNVASRFSGLAHPGQILVTKSVVPRLGPDTQLLEHPPAAVKGKAERLDVIEVLYSCAKSEAASSVIVETKSAAQLTAVVCHN